MVLFLAVFYFGRHMPSQRRRSNVDTSHMPSQRRRYNVFQSFTFIGIRGNRSRISHYPVMSNCASGCLRRTKHYVKSHTHSRTVLYSVFRYCVRRRQRRWHQTTHFYSHYPIRYIPFYIEAIRPRGFIHRTYSNRGGR